MSDLRYDGPDRFVVPRETLPRSAVTVVAKNFSARLSKPGRPARHGHGNGRPFLPGPLTGPATRAMLAPEPETTAMQYMILFYETQADYDTRGTRESNPGYWGAWGAYIGAIAEAGVMVGGAALHGPETGTTVRIAGGERHVQDGPVAGIKEQLGGYVTIDVPDLDTAIAWAARAPSSITGATEVRPVLPMT